MNKKGILPNNSCNAFIDSRKTFVIHIDIIFRLQEMMPVPHPFRDKKIPPAWTAGRICKREKLLLHHQKMM